MPKIQLYTKKCIRQVFKCSMHVSNRKVIYKGDIDQKSMPRNIPTLAPKPLRIYTCHACNGTQHVRTYRDHLVNARACICKAQCNAIHSLNYWIEFILCTVQNTGMELCSDL